MIVNTAFDFVTGRPRGRLVERMRPSSINSPPHTPQGSLRASAPDKHSALVVHRAQIALARAMSTNSSEKNKYDRVPLPSLQRIADSTNSGLSSMANLKFSLIWVSLNCVSNSVSSLPFVICVVWCCLLLDLANLASRRKNKKTAGFSPDGLVDLSDVKSFYVRSPSRCRAGCLVE